MHAYDGLRAIRAFEREHLRALATVEDFDLVLEIAYHEALGRPLNLKRLFLLDAAPAATVQRRLRRLKREGVIEQRRSPLDGRAVEIQLTPRFRKVYLEYDTLIGAGLRVAPRRPARAGFPQPLTGPASVRARSKDRHCPRPPARRATTYTKTLYRACLAVGGLATLAARLGVGASTLRGWMLGQATPALEAFLACVEIVLLAIEKPGGRA